MIEGQKGNEDFTSDGLEGGRRVGGTKVCEDGKEDGKTWRRRMRTEVCKGVGEQPGKMRRGDGGRGKLLDQVFPMG